MPYIIYVYVCSYAAAAAGDELGVQIISDIFHMCSHHIRT